MKATISLTPDEVENIIRKHIIETQSGINKIVGTKFIIGKDYYECHYMSSIEVSVELK